MKPSGPVQFVPRERTKDDQIDDLLKATDKLIDIVIMQNALIDRLLIPIEYHECSGDERPIDYKKYAS